jgi:hypothetical protein
LVTASAAVECHQRIHAPGSGVKAGELHWLRAKNAAGKQHRSWDYNRFRKRHSALQYTYCTAGFQSLMTTSNVDFHSMADAQRRHAPLPSLRRPSLQHWQPQQQIRDAGANH